VPTVVDILVPCLLANAKAIQAAVDFRGPQAEGLRNALKTKVRKIRHGAPLLDCG
jgi:hypothetical protein